MPTRKKPAPKATKAKTTRKGKALASAVVPRR